MAVPSVAVCEVEKIGVVHVGAAALVEVVDVEVLVDEV